MPDYLKNLFQFKINCVFIIIYLALIAHGASITDTFKILDNDISIIHNPLIKDIGHINEIFATSYFGLNQFYRPMVSLSHMAEFQLFGLNASFYHLTNIILHGMTSVMVFFIAARLFGRHFLGLMAGILFAIHPMHWEAVANIPGRSILLCALFYLLSFYAFLRLTERSNSLKWFALSLGCYAAALLSKESAITLPVLLAAYALIFANRKGEGKKLLLLTLPFWAISCALMLIRNALGITQVTFSKGIGESIFPFLTFLKAALIHLRMMIIPTGFYYDRSYSVFHSFSDPQLIIAAFLWAAIIGALISKRAILNKNLLFLFFWFALSLSTVSQLFYFVAVSPGMIAASDHMMYLPAVSVCAALAYAGAHFLQWMGRQSAQSKFLAKLHVVAILIAFFSITVLNDISARDEIKMLRYSHQLNPLNRRVHQSYAVALNRAGHYEKAVREYQDLLRADPEDERAHIGLGRVYCDQKMLYQCIDQFEQAAFFSGNDPGILADLRRLYGYLISENLDKINSGMHNPRLYFQLGVAYRFMGDDEKAKKYFSMANSSHTIQNSGF